MTGSGCVDVVFAVFLKLSTRLLTRLSTKSNSRKRKMVSIKNAAISDLSGKYVKPTHQHHAALTP